MKLNGWQRIGIVLSIFWFLGMGVKVNYDANAYADKETKTLYGYCMKDAAVGTDFDKCWNNQKTNEIENKADYFSGASGWLIIIGAAVAKS